MPIDSQELDCRFTYHAPTEGQPAKYEAIRAKAHELAALVVELTPASREQALALTNIEQACMWANAAIARRSEPHTHDSGPVATPGGS